MAKVKSDKKFKPNKKYREKTEKAKTDAKEKINSNSFFTVSSLSYIILFAIFLLSFYVKGIEPIGKVLGNGVTGFAMDDSVFHMRLVENTIQFFPHRIFFDAFTLYPYGTQLHWGPLFDQIIAFFALVAGLFTNGGMPSQTTIDTIGVFYPAILGALVVFPVYFICRELADEKAGLFAAFLIAILPGQFLSRSVLGFTDNHVAEVLFTTMMMMFFIMAIKKAENITFDHWLNRDWKALKAPVLYSLLAGLSFGAYLLIWTFGVFFAVVFGTFVVIQYIIDHFRGKSTEYLGIVGVIAYMVAMVMILPYFDLGNGFAPRYYSMLHLVVTGGGALVFAFLSLVSREMNKREFEGYHYLLFVIGTVLMGLIAIKILTPDLYGSTLGSWNYVFQGQTGGGLTIAEASPTMFLNAPQWMVNDYSGIAYFLAYIGFPIGEASGTILRNALEFGYNFYWAYIAILILGFYVIKKQKAEYTLLVVWSLLVLAIMLAQNRFAYYYAVNVAILSGFLVSKVLNLFDWKNFSSNDVVECLKEIKIQHVLSLILIIIPTVLIPVEDVQGVPLYQRTFLYSITHSTEWGAVSPADGFYEWHDTLTWMRDNTPDPDLKYYDIYEQPKNGTYPYPESAYGVMSWWDYGHIITYWGHRIPNANPFQEGIGGGPNHEPGASTFLIAPSEEKANEILDKLGTNGKPGARYIVSNAYMAYSILTVFADWDNTDQGYYFGLQTDQGTIPAPTMKYYDTMEARLHIFDANGLSHYRLVHESKPNEGTRGGSDERQNKYLYDILYKGNLPIESTGYAKIFEYVKGAKITGRAPPNATVTLTNTIKTNIGRTFQYTQTTTSNGTYEFTVPYSTEGPIPNQTHFDTQPTGPYTVTAGNISKTVRVSEETVLDGGTVPLNLV